MIVSWTIDWCPYRITDKQSHGMNIMFLVCSETMIGTSRQRDQIAFLDEYTNPLIIHVANVKVAGSVYYQSDLIIRMQMLTKEDFELFSVSWMKKKKVNQRILIFQVIK